MYCSIKVKRKVLSLMFVVILHILMGIFTTVFFISASDTLSEGEVALPVLMYHSVCYNKVTSDYIITPEVFEQDMIYLKEKGYTSISGSELIDYVYNNTPLPEKPILITFDDGYLNNLTYVLPILEKYDIKAIISIVGEYSERFSISKDENPSYAHMSWNQLNDLKASGRIEIGNHTYNMHQLGERRGCKQKAGESDETYKDNLYNDLNKLQNILTEQCKETPVIFAYPYGFISKNSIPVIKELGFKMDFTCSEKLNYLSYGDTEKLYSLCRFNRPSGISTSAFMTKNNIV